MREREVGDAGHAVPGLPFTSGCALPGTTVGSGSAGLSPLWLRFLGIPPFILIRLHVVIVIIILLVVANVVLFGGM